MVDVSTEIFQKLYGFYRKDLDRPVSHAMVLSFIYIYIYIFYLVYQILVAACKIFQLWNVVSSSLNRDQTWAPYTGSMES